MKKIINALKNYHPSKWLSMLFMLVPFVIISTTPYKVLDNDRFFLLSLGRAITSNGLPVVDPLAMHHASFIAQQWLFDIILYTIYKYLGDKGLVVLTHLLLGIMTYIYYKLCLLVSKNRYTFSSVITTIFITCFAFFFGRTRPQLFEAVILLLELYLLEKYVDSNNAKYLYYLPILSILMVNLHSSCFFMLFAFILPYLLNIKNPLTDYQEYKIKPLLIVTVVMLLSGLINPYGYKAITYLFHSYGIDVINDLVGEMHALTFRDVMGKVVFAIIFIILFIYIFGKKKIKTRYVLLFLGTLYLALAHLKGIQYFLPVAFYPLCDTFKDRFLVSSTELPKEVRLYYFSFLILLLVLPIFNFIIIKDYPPGDEEPVEIVKYLEEHVEDKSRIKIYTDYNDGGYFEFHGFVPYLDSRAEVFIDNGVLEEFRSLVSGNLNFTDFLDKYDFDYLVVDSGDLLIKQYLSTTRNTKYILVLNEITNKERNVGYALYQKVS